MRYVNVNVTRETSRNICVIVTLNLNTNKHDRNNNLNLGSHSSSVSNQTSIVWVRKILILINYSFTFNHWENSCISNVFPWNSWIYKRHVVDFICTSDYYRNDWQYSHRLCSCLQKTNVEYVVGWLFWIFKLLTPFFSFFYIYFRTIYMLRWFFFMLPYSRNMLTVNWAISGVNMTEQNFLRFIFIVPFILASNIWQICCFCWYQHHWLCGI